MSEQLLDFQSVFSTLRRSRLLLVGLALVGGLVGAGAMVLWPPAYTSSSQVLLPSLGNNAATGDNTGGDSATQVRVATSDVVLAPAGRAVSPALSARDVQRRVRVSAPTENLLRITAKGDTPREAEMLASAVAKSEVAYQAEAASSLSEAEQTSLAKRHTDLSDEYARIGQEISATKKRMAAEVTGSNEWHDDATALAELNAQQAQLALQVDTLEQKLANTNATGPGARIVDGPTPATRSTLWLRYTITALLGAGLALVLGTVVLLASRRRDRRLRTRDEIADAIGSAVIGSVRTRPPRAAAGWAALLETYEPGVMDAWSLRQVLDHVGAGDTTHSNHGEGPKQRHAINLMSLSDDTRALAVGPQLASYAASVGLTTRLVTAQGHETAAALWTACSSFARDQEIRRGLFAGKRRAKASDDVTVEMVVVDRRNPTFMGLDRHAITLLAVASSSVTAEDLARAAVATYEAGSRISGVIVADPDSLDRTSGRLLLQQRLEQLTLPTRLTGIDGTESDRTRRGAE